jgi:hypothetical protein
MNPKWNGFDHLLARHWRQFLRVSRIAYCEFKTRDFLLAEEEQLGMARFGVARLNLFAPCSG